MRRKKRTSNAQKRKKRAENTAVEKENINAQRRKKRAEKKAASELVRMQFEAYWVTSENKHN